MLNFTIKSGAHLNREMVEMEVAKDSHPSETLKRLGFSASKGSQDNFLRWCLKRDIPLSHYIRRNSSKRGIVGQTSDSELLRIAKDSSSYSDICRSLGVLAAGCYFRSIKSRLDSLGFYHFDPLAKSPYSKKVYIGTIPDELFFVSGKERSGKDIKIRLLRMGVKNECSLCSCPPMWNGLPLVLQVDHIDGDHANNKLDNLRLACPNCHTQTINFCGKNIQCGRRKKHLCSSCGKPRSKTSSLCRACSNRGRAKFTIDKETLLCQLSEGNGISSVARKNNVSAPCIRKACVRMDIDYSIYGRQGGKPRSLTTRADLPEAHTREKNL